MPLDVSRWLERSSCTRIIMVSMLFYYNKSWRKSYCNIFNFINVVIIFVNSVCFRYSWVSLTLFFLFESLFSFVNLKGKRTECCILHAGQSASSRADSCHSGKQHLTIHWRAWYSFWWASPAIHQGKIPSQPSPLMTHISFSQCLMVPLCLLSIWFSLGFAGTLQFSDHNTFHRMGS